MIVDTRAPGHFRTELMKQIVACWFSYCATLH